MGYRRFEFSVRRKGSCERKFWYFDYPQFGRGNFADEVRLDERCLNLTSPLTPAEERRIFLGYNWENFKLSRNVNEFGELSEQGHGLLEKITFYEEKIFGLNLPLVSAMIVRGKFAGDPNEFFSLGYLALLDSIRHFDCLRGFKFSTYACNSIQRRIVNYLQRNLRKSSKFINGDPEASEEYLNSCVSDYYKTSPKNCIVNIAVESLPESLFRVLGKREEEVIRARYLSGEKRTLEDIGEEIGLAKERIRQIEKSALEKMKRFLLNIDSHEAARVFS